MNRRYLTGIALLLVLAGCSDNTEPTAVDQPSATATTPTPTPTPTPTDAAEPPDSPEPATATPAASAGPLSARNLPAPAALGKGWTSYDDPGGAEKGFQGNGTWTRRRDAHQAAYEALPVGCAGGVSKTGLPIPQYALQGTYRNQAGSPAQLLVLRFADEAKATTYFDGYRARLRGCSKPGGALTIKPLWTTSAQSAWQRRYTDASYTEVSVRSVSTVALLANSAAPTDAWTHAAATKLVSTISR